MASHKFEDLKKRCEGIKFDPMIQPRVGLTFILVPDPSIIDREASIKATMTSKKQTYIIIRDFETVIRKVIAKLFCNLYRYVIQIRGKDDGVFLDPKFFSITLNAYYAGGKIDGLKLIKEFSRLGNYNQEWRSLSRMIHAVVIEEPDDSDRPVMEEDGILIPEGFSEFEAGGWCCWKNKTLENNTGLSFEDPQETLKNSVESGLFNNEIFANTQNNGMFERLFDYQQKIIPGTNVSIYSNNIKKGKTVNLNNQSDDFDNGNISFVPKKKKVSEDDFAYFNGGNNKPKNKKLPAEHKEILYGNKKKKLLTPEQIQRMNDEIEAYETNINKEA